MHARRPSAARPEPGRTDAAARRLALLAADLGAPTPPPGRVDPAGGADTQQAWWADHTRVAPPPAEEPARPERPVADRPLPPALPEPGRHAARRPRALGLRRRAGAIGDRVPGLGPAHVAVVAVVVALGLAVTTWWVARDRPRTVEPLSAEPVAPLVGGATTTAPAGPSASPATSVTVDVAGKVRRPGIVVLDQGARVADALEAAGGPRRGVDLTSVNLARVLVDGEQVVVGTPSTTPAAPTGGTGGATGSAGPLVNLNLASQSELETLPQVGPVTAQSIIAWREQNGGFTSIDELLEVDGIGDKTLAQLTPHVTV